MNEFLNNAPEVNLIEAAVFIPEGPDTQALEQETIRALRDQLKKREIKHLSTYPTTYLSVDHPSIQNIVTIGLEPNQITDGTIEMSISDNPLIPNLETLSMSLPPWGRDDLVAATGVDKLRVSFTNSEDVYNGQSPYF